MKEQELIDYNWWRVPLDELEKSPCFYCRKDYCLLATYLETKEGNQEIFFCCDHCFKKWEEQEIIVIPNKLGYYFLETKPKPLISTCQNCWPSKTYWISKSSEFRIFGKSSSKGECNTCGKDNCHVVGEITIDSSNMKIGYYFCSLKCCQIWQIKYEVQKRIGNWKYL
jgi:hypothetical protein